MSKNTLSVNFRSPAVEYALGQDPYLLKTWNFDLQGSSSALMALAPDALTVAIATGTRLLILDVNSGEGEEIEEAHSGELIF